MSGGDRHLLLLGGGHAQLAVLQALAREGGCPAGWRVSLVTPQPRLLYSGMLPGWMAGHYGLDELAIDLRRLAGAAGARWCQAWAVALDAPHREVLLSDGQRLGYDRLSLDIGSTVALGPLEGWKPPQLLPVRPLADFVTGWQHVLAQAAVRTDFALAVLGGGAGGVELAFAARQRLGCRVSLVTGEGGVLPGHAPAVQARARHWLGQRGVRCLAGPATPGPGRAGLEQGGPSLSLPDGTPLHADVLLAATGAQPAAWLRTSGLTLAASGQVLVDAQQRSVSHADVFAAGDTCQRTDGRLHASGVHAVRAGPVLAFNLLASLRGQRLRAWRPRAHSLYLLTTGPRHALMSYGPFSAAGDWVWRWKDRIDRAFIARHAGGRGLGA